MDEIMPVIFIDCIKECIRSTFLFFEYNSNCFGRNEFDIAVTIVQHSELSVVAIEIWPIPVPDIIKLATIKSNPLFNTLPKLFNEFHIPDDNKSKTQCNENSLAEKWSLGVNFFVRRNCDINKKKDAIAEVRPTYHTFGDRLIMQAKSIET